MIVETQKTIFGLMASENANQLIYYIKRLPIIGKHLPDSLYANLSMKKVLAVVAEVLKFFKGIFGKIIYIGLLMALPAFFLEKDPAARYSSFLHVFTMFSLIGSFLSSFLFESSQERYICVRLMRMNAKKYIISTWIVNEVSNFFTFLPVVLLSAVLLGGTAAQALFLTVIMTGFELGGEAFFLLLYSRTKLIPCKKTAYEVIVGFFLLVATYLPIILHRPLPLKGLLFHPAFLVFAVGLLVCSALVILHYDGYHEIAMNTLKADALTVDTEKAITEATIADVTVREKDFSASDLKPGRFERKTGFAYLNALFFERHRRLLVKPVIIQLAIIAVLFCAAVIASFFNPKLDGSLPGPGTVLPLFVFILYLVSIGERVCKAMFYNCDISLLRYPFYRNRDAILSNFKVRLLRVSGLNLITATAIAAAVIGLVWIFKLGWTIPDQLSFVCSILLLSLFFSVHHLFLYYVFQPYTTEHGVKNPFYSAINSGVYLLCFLCLKLKSPPSYFTLIVLVSTSIYIIVALILVYRLAPKTFRVK